MAGEAQAEHKPGARQHAVLRSADYPERAITLVPVQIRDIPILMYHSISRGVNPRFTPFTLSPEFFVAHMAYLNEHRYVPITVEQAVQAILHAGVNLPERPVILTFDDGFADFYTTALPILKQHNFVATLYVVTAFVGGTSRWLWREKETERPMLTWRQLAEISANGIECGAHSHSHPQLDLLLRRVAQDEITQCKAILEDRLARPVTSFAYPFGYHTAAVRRMVQAAGYTSACTVRHTVGIASHDTFALSRRTVAPGTGTEGLDALLSRRGATVAAAFEPGRALVWRMVRRSVDR